MKNCPPTQTARVAFTLIELITVIAIIAILMSLLFPVTAAAREAARRAKASATVRTIVNSCKTYVTDYGKHPPISAALVAGGNTSAPNQGPSGNAYYSYGDTEVAKCKVANNQFFDVLRAIPRGANSDHALNKRRQSYYEENKAADARNPRDGFTDGKDFAEEMQGQLLDPWGKQYCIVLDADGDNLVTLRDFFRTLPNQSETLPPHSPWQRITTSAAKAIKAGSIMSARPKHRKISFPGSNR